MPIVPFTILVVLYNLKPQEAPTLQSLSKCKHLLNHSRLIIRDNSPTPLSTEEVEATKVWLQGLNVTYIFNNGENLSLSYIYNETIKVVQPTEYLVLFDHDSTFDEHYFVEAQKAITAHPEIDLFLPLIYCGESLVSPSNMVYFKGSRWKKERTGIVPSHRHTASNSGMIISERFLREYPGYNEKLRFYGTDNDFMWKYENLRSTFCVFPYRMLHSLDFYTKDEPFKQKAKRFVDIRQSLIISMEERGVIAKLLAGLYMDLYSIKFAIIQRNPKFIFLR